jgi:hypothetical protein
MASGNPLMDVKYRCNTHKHKKQEKMTRMRGRKKTWSCFVHLNTCIVTCSHYVHTCSLHNIEYIGDVLAYFTFPLCSSCTIMNITTTILALN